jgi:heme/copper-type cytochrome/quinol oxidase subunit 2
VKETEKPAATTALKSDDSGNSNLGIIIGIIAAGVVVCAAIIVLAVRATKKNQ